MPQDILDQLDQLDWAQQEQVVLPGQQGQAVLLVPMVLLESELRAVLVRLDLPVLLVLAAFPEDKVIRGLLAAPDQLVLLDYTLQQPRSQELILLSH